MKPVSVKIPKLDKLPLSFNDVQVFSDNGAYVNFGNNSNIDFEDIGKTISLTFSPEDWTWCIGISSHTSIDTDDLCTLFPKRKFKAPRRCARIGCTSVRIDDNLDIVVGSEQHKCTEEEITQVEELLAARREMKKTIKDD